MSFLETFNREKLDQTVNVTIRMPIIMRKTLSDISDHYNSTVSSLIVEFIQDKLFKEWEQIKLNQQEKNDKEIDSEIENNKGEFRFFILNTNSSNSLEDHEWIVSNGYAAAFENGYKEKINRIGEHDVVFLYESGVGIVGYGYAEKELIKTNFHNKPEDTYYKKLKDYQRIQKPIKHALLKEILVSFSTTGTLSIIKNKGEDLVIYIKKNNN